MQEAILSSVKEAIAAASVLQEPQTIAFMEQAAQAIIRCYVDGKKLIVAGNGGSLCDAMHFAEEFTGQFRHKRRALPAIALSDPGHLSCVANDMGYENVFSRGIEAHGQPGDVFVALSTSGNSRNLLFALETAKEKGLFTVAFLGKFGGEMRGKADLEWIVSGFPYSDRIQEAHMAAIHIVIERVEEALFPHLCLSKMRSYGLAKNK